MAFNFVTTAARWLSARLKMFWSSNKPAAFEDLEALAFESVKSIIVLDRASAVEEIILTAKTTGQKWGFKLLDEGEGKIREALLEHYTASDLKRYLALARVTVAAVNKYGASAMPQTKLLFGIIEAALLKLDESMGE